MILKPFLEKVFLLYKFWGCIKLNKKVNVYLLIAIMFLQGLVFYGPVATLYRQSRGLSMYSIFVIESILMVLMLVFEIPWGWFADRYGYKLTLVITYVLLFISKIVFYKANSFSLFLLERILMALSLSGISGCDIALLYLSADKGDSQKVFGFFTAGGSAGYLTACLLSSIMVKKSIDFTALCTILPFGAAAILTFFLKDIEHGIREKVSIRMSMKHIITCRYVLIIVISAALSGEVTHSVSVFLNQLQYLRSGIGIGYFGLLTALMQVVCLLSAKAYKFTEKFGKKKTVKALIFNILAGCVLLTYTKNPAYSILMIAVIEGSFAVLQPIIMDIENKSILTINRATILSMYAMTGDTISALVNLVIGRSADYSIQRSFMICAIISAAAFIMAWFYFHSWYVEDKQLN